MTDLHTLAARVMALTGPEYRMEIEIENALGLAVYVRDEKVIYGDAEYGRRPPKPYTASFDAAMSLAPAGKHPVHLLRNAIDRCLAHHIGDHDGFLKALPRYITAAALLARSETV
jgi:hypothetical protein